MIYNAQRKETLFVGGIAGGLAAMAGFINAIVLQFYFIPASHMTGAIARLSSSAATMHIDEFMHLAAIVGGFTLGAVVSGFISGDDDVKPVRRYGLVFALEALALGAAILVFKQFPQHTYKGIGFVAAACGLQNAFATKYRGLILRTTHLSGAVTDIGAMMGRMMRKRKLELWRLAVQSMIIFGFFAGGMFGIFMQSFFGVNALSFAALLCLTLAIASWVQFKR